MATFCCSIETEPRTLNQGELNHAREVAVGIVQANESVEASRIFSEGLKPVIGMKEMDVAIERNDSIHKLQDVSGDISLGTSSIDKTQCQCSLITLSPIADSPARLKEPCSAPF